MSKSDQQADANSRFSEDQRPRPPFEGRVECVVDYVHTISFHESNFVEYFLKTVFKWYVLF